MSVETKDELIWNIFGSETSIDCDVMVIVNKKLTPHESHQLCTVYKQKLHDISTKDINVNLAVIKDSVIEWVFKGTPDECNNSIYDTYGLHKQAQKYPCIVGKRMQRNVNLKIVRALRVILTFLTRTVLRKECKEALRINTVNARLAALEQVDFSKLDVPDVVNSYKTIAFQIGQTMALINGIEVYSKTDVGKLYANLVDFLARKEKTDVSILTKALGELIVAVRQLIKQDPDIGTLKEVL
jgi:hypothetical protein